MVSVVIIIIEISFDILHSREGGMLAFTFEIISINLN